MSGAITPVVAAIDGIMVSLEALTADHDESLRELDWLRSLHPVMAGPLASQRRDGDTTRVVRARETGRVIGVLDSRELPGYPGVANVSMYTDEAHARGGLALEAYGRFVLHVFEQGSRLVHHEVLEMNKPIQRVFAGVGLEATARLRSHAYVAGRFWDVLVYSYDRAQLDGILERTFPRSKR